MLNKKIALHCARYINLFLHQNYILYTILFFSRLARLSQRVWETRTRRTVDQELIINYTASTELIGVVKIGGVVDQRP